MPCHPLCTGGLNAYAQTRSRLQSPQRPSSRILAARQLPSLSQRPRQLLDHLPCGRASLSPWFWWHRLMHRTALRDALARDPRHQSQQDPQASDQLRHAAQSQSALTSVPSSTSTDARTGLLHLEESHQATACLLCSKCAATLLVDPFGAEHHAQCLLYASSSSITTLSSTRPATSFPFPVKAVRHSAKANPRRTRTRRMKPKRCRSG